MLLKQCIVAVLAFGDVLFSVDNQDVYLFLLKVNTLNLEHTKNSKKDRKISSVEMESVNATGLLNIYYKALFRVNGSGLASVVSHKLWISYKLGEIRGSPNKLYVK
ncbi:unnamed protein product [Larinioides sclopetarius]|uniref:Uncharacterized protein n=1 Tax=Larinioides sclopetarius TaxID=280406 RepID=A0AAV1Z6K2_9ARAC